MEERKNSLRNFAEKFYYCIKRKRNPKVLLKDLEELSSHFQFSLKEKSYEEVLEDLFKGDLKKEKTISKEWFSILLGEFKDESQNVKFSVSRIKDSFKKDLLSSYSLPFEERVLNKYFPFVNERGMEKLSNEILNGVSNRKDYCSIYLMINVKKDLIGPHTLIPNLLFSHCTNTFSANLLYVTAPINGKCEAALEISRYYPPNSKLLLALINLRECIENFKYNSFDLFQYFLFSKKFENCLRRERLL